MIVNVAIRTKTPEMIEFFYPNFTRISTYSPFIEGGVIFDGDASYLQKFRDAGIPYIYVKGTPEYDLTIVENLLDFVYQKWDKKPPKRILDYVSELDYGGKDTEEINNMCKQIWVTGKCSIEEESEERLQNLYKSLSRLGSYDLMKDYLELSESINSEKLFYSIQSFLKKTKDPSSVKSAWTQKNLNAFNEARGGNVQNALIQYLYSPSDRIEIKMLKLLDALTVIKHYK